MAGQRSVEDVLKKWQANAGQATESIKAGVNRVTESPPQAAAAKADLWQQRVSSSEARTKFQQNAGAVSLSEWKNMMLTKGINNYQNGVREGAPKMRKFLTEFLPLAAASSEQVKAMPKGSEQDAINRFVANMRNLKSFRKS
jgi:hypothetical protein